MSAIRRPKHPDSEYRVPIDPLAQWLRERIARGTLQSVADRVGVDPALVARRAKGQTDTADGRTHIFNVDKFLTRLGRPEDLNVLYPPDHGRVWTRWCPACRENTLADRAATCPWCDSPTRVRLERRTGALVA